MKSLKEKLFEYHVIILTIVVTHIFTYANVDLPFLEVIQHEDYIVNLVLNGLQIYLLFKLSYFLAYKKQKSFLFSTIIGLLVFALVTAGSAYFLDYEPEDYTEMYTMTIPFGAIILIGVNLFYYYHKQLKSKNSTPSLDERYFWIKTSSGRKKLFPSKFRYAMLDGGILKVFMEDGQIYSDISLSNLEESFEEIDGVLRFNRQSIGKKVAITSLKSKEDGRLELGLFDGAKILVSKNNAASMKKKLS